MRGFYHGAGLSFVGMYIYKQAYFGMYSMIVPRMGKMDRF